MTTLERSSIYSLLGALLANAAKGEDGTIETAYIIAACVCMAVGLMNFFSVLLRGDSQ
jgi:hypothetical protein